MNIKAIETVYKGYRFRSRLEARCAILFDSLGIEWEYEKEGFDLGKLGWYLPDFEIKLKDGTELFVEVKGDNSDVSGIQKANYLDERSYELGKISVLFLTKLEHAYYKANKDGLDFNSAYTISVRLGVSVGKYNKAINKARSARFEHGETP